MKSQSKIQNDSSAFKLFREPFDSYNLAVPILLLAGVLVEIFLLRGALNAYTNHIQFFQDFVFFSQLHPSMTYVLLISTATGHKITREFVSRFGFIGIFRVAAVFVGSAVGFFLFTRNVAPNEWLYAVFALTFIVARDHHKLSQSKGLTKLVNQVGGVSPQTSNIELKMIMLFIIPSVLVQFVFLDQSLPWNGKKDLILGICFGLAVVMALSLWSFAFFSTKKVRAWKALYAPRYFCKILSPFSVLANFGTGAVHGVEYLGVVDSISEADRKLLPSRRSGVWVTIVFVAIIVPYAVMTRPDFFLGNVSVNRLYVDLLLSLAVGFGWTHFFLDHLLFSPKYQLGTPFLNAIKDYAGNEKTERSFLP